MASQLMKSVSGIRGIVGDTLVPDVIVKTGSSFARYTKKGTIIVGRDARPTGSIISDMLKSVLLLSGCNVVDVGIIPTPTLELAVRELKADGGIMISASHNPVEWNAFKLVNKSGTFLNEKEIGAFFSLMEKTFLYAPWNRIGNISNKDVKNIHVKKVLKHINREKIKKKSFKVVLDSVNGAGSEITLKLLSELNCVITPLYCSINSGKFPRGAEPVPANLKDLSKAVKKQKADIGFAQDPDADRLAIVNELGEPIGEENTLALVTEHILSGKKKGRVVVNLSTTKAIEDIAGKYGCTVKRTKVGEINVTEEMIKNGALIGGEGNGGVISPGINMGRDSLAGIGYILEMMAERNMTVSGLVKSIPRYFMKKGKVDLKKNIDKEKAYTNLKNIFKGEKFSTIDGLRIDFARHPEFTGGWAHLRPSNTEPVFRIITEGKDEEQASKIYDYFVKMF